MYDIRYYLCDLDILCFWNALITEMAMLVLYNFELIIIFVNT
jgi:hypothetical protein